MKIPKSIRDIMKCQKCGKKYIPDKNAVSMNKSHTKYIWDGHTYKPDCKCFSKDIRISIG
jgi:hypothetical protein